MEQKHNITKLDFNQQGRSTAASPFLAAYNRPTVSVIVPTINEEKNLPYILPKIPAWIDEVILVDGRSEDNTVEVAKELMPDIKVVLETTKGKGAALRAGFNASTCDIIIMIDADGSMAPEEMSAYVGALVAGADFAKGSRFIQGGGTDDMEYYRFLGNWGLTKMVTLLFGGNYSDLCYGYAAFWRRVLPALELESNGFEIETEMNVRALRAGLKITEVPSFEADRVHGSSNLNTWKDGWRVLNTIVREFWDKIGPNTFGQKETVEVVQQVDHFTPAMKLLAQEAKHLYRRRSHLNADAYRQGVDAIKAASWALLTMEVEHPEGRDLQDQYMKNSETMWLFLEEANAEKQAQSAS
jgi:glycosyltransferase involved in cell wall biosynthesis